MCFSQCRIAYAALRSSSILLIKHVQAVLKSFLSILSWSCARSAATKSLKLYRAVVMFPMALSVYEFANTTWQRYSMFTFEFKVWRIFRYLAVIVSVCSTIFVGTLASSVIYFSSSNVSSSSTSSSDWIQSQRGSESYSRTIVSATFLKVMSSRKLSKKESHARASNNILTKIVSLLSGKFYLLFVQFMIWNDRTDRLSSTAVKRFALKISLDCNSHLWRIKLKRVLNCDGKIRLLRTFYHAICVCLRSRHIWWKRRLS